jgi:DNA-binding FadR family transcriptional regulator
MLRLYASAEARIAVATRKLAEITASRIEQDIIASGWKPGHNLGSETDLIIRYGVSRAVFREAVRLVEHHQAAEMRRGPGGGLVVGEPDPAAVSNAMAIYFQYQRVRYGQLYEARMALELWSVETTIRSLDETGINRLRDYLRDEEVQLADGIADTTHLFHELIADLTGNPVLSLFVQSLTTLSRRQRLHQQSVEVFREVHMVHRKIAEAIIRGDSGLARHRMLRHLEAMSSWIVHPDEDDDLSPAQPLSPWPQTADRL